LEGEGEAVGVGNGRFPNTKKPNHLTNTPDALKIGEKIGDMIGLVNWQETRAARRGCRPPIFNFAHLTKLVRSAVTKTAPQQGNLESSLLGRK
jgi:hypothetical protein